MLLIPFGVIFGGYTLAWYGAELILDAKGTKGIKFMDLLKWDKASISKFGSFNIPGGTNTNDAQVRESLSTPGADSPAPTTALADYGRQVNYRSALSSMQP